MTTPLMDRIKAAEQRSNLRQLRPSEPVPFRPRWLARLEAKDYTDAIYSNGTHRPAGSGDAA